MSLPPDFEDMAAALVGAEVRFLVVGAHALAMHGEARATGDIDYWVEPTPENARRVMSALAEFGAPLAAHQVTALDFERPGMIYQLGLPPLRIDLLTAIDGVEFAEALDASLAGELGRVPVRYLSLGHMLANKLAAGRPKDLADVAVLRELLAR